MLKSAMTHRRFPAKYLKIETESNYDGLITSARQKICCDDDVTILLGFYQNIGRLQVTKLQLRGACFRDMKRY